VWIKEYNMQHQLEVKGMTCGHCEMAVKKAVQRLDPQAQIEIERSHNQVRIESQQPRAELARVIAEEGYAVA
jgi:copper chaperone